MEAGWEVNLGPVARLLVCFLCCLLINVACQSVCRLAWALLAEKVGGELRLEGDSGASALASSLEVASSLWGTFTFMARPSHLGPCASLGVLSPYRAGAFTTSPGPKSSVYGEELQVCDFWVTDPLEINISGSTSKCSESSAVIDIRIFLLCGWDSFVTAGRLVYGME